MAVRALTGESVNEVNAVVHRPLKQEQLTYIGLRERITSKDPARVHAPLPFHIIITVDEAHAGPATTLLWLRSAKHPHVIYISMLIR